MKNSKFSLLTLLFISLDYINSIMISLNGIEKDCFFKNMNKDDYFKYSFVVSGENQETVEVNLMDPFHGTIDEKKGKEEGEFGMKVKYDGTGV